MHLNQNWISEAGEDLMMYEWIYLQFFPKSNVIKILAMRAIYVASSDSCCNVLSSKNLVSN